MPLEVNMSYEIKPGLSIGQIQLGMDRNKVNELITELEEWKDTPYGYKKEVIYDCNDDFQIMYDDDLRVSFILCTSPERLTMLGKCLNSELFYEDILEMIKAQDPSIEEDEEGFISNELGFGLNFDYDDDEQIFITCVQVAVKDFWANEPCEE